MSASLSWQNFIIAGTFFAIYMSRSAYQRYLMRRRKKPDKPEELAELAFAVIPKNILAILAVFFLLIGVPTNRMFLLGWLIFLLGIALRFISLYKLGEMYSINVEIRHDHELVKSGIYGMVRHPLALAYIVDSVGIIIFLQNWYLVPFLFFIVVGISLRARNEELALRKHFGDAYNDYAKDVPAVNIFASLYRIIKR